MTAIYYDSKHSDDERRARLYRGDIYVYSPTDEGMALCQLAQTQCAEAFTPHQPPFAHRELEVAEYNEILKTLKPGFIHHPECKSLLPALLRRLGCDENKTYFDVPRLRTACPAEYLSSGLAYAFKPHRDTWYSTPMSQLNWWLPAYPITADNCMTFHLNYWDRPLRNSSAGFNYQDWNNVGRKSAHNQGKVDNRVQSEALEKVDLDPQVRIVCEPGSVIVFSAAHLHSTVPNSTDETRISIDFRTVHLAELEGDLGAPNLDSESTGTTTADYLRVSDLCHLPDSMISQHLDWVPQPKHPNQFDPNSPSNSSQVQE